MKIFLMLFMILFAFAHMGCQGSKVSPTDVRKVLCSVSPTAYDSAALLCEKLPKKKRETCLTAVSIARAGHVSLCGLDSYLYTPPVKIYTEKERHEPPIGKEVAYYQLE